MSKFQNPDGSVVDETEIAYQSAFHERRVNACAAIILRFKQEYKAEWLEAMASIGLFPEDHVSEYMKEKIIEDATDDIIRGFLENYEPEGI